MDQNRCLLDVIDNPQLLQSFLESESSADTTNTNTTNAAQNAAAIANNNDATPSTQSLPPPSTPTTPATTISTQSNVDQSTLSSTNIPLLSTTTTFDPATLMQQDTIACTTNSTTDATTSDTTESSTNTTTTASCIMQIEPQSQASLSTTPAAQSSLQDQTQQQQSSPPPTQPISSLLSTTTTFDSATPMQQDTIASTTNNTTDTTTSDTTESFTNITTTTSCIMQLEPQSQASLSTTPAAQSSLQDQMQQQQSSPPPTQSVSSLSSKTHTVSSTNTNHINDNEVSDFNYTVATSADSQEADNDNNNQPIITASATSSIENTYSTFVDSASTSASVESAVTDTIFSLTSHSIAATEVKSDAATTSMIGTENQLTSRATSNDTIDIYQNQNTNSNTLNDRSADSTGDIYIPTTTTASTENGSFKQAVKLERISNDPTITLPVRTTPAPSLAAKKNSASSNVTAGHTTTTNSNTKTVKNSGEAKPATKRAPRSRAKNNKNSGNSATNSPMTTPNQPLTPKPMLQQYGPTPSGQQQILYQPGNVGLRQPTMIAPTSMGQPMGGGVPQQQRVIQIQTANGPMYFAIAPGPMVGNNSMVNQQAGMQSQQQYSSQQLCFQPNSSVMINRPPLSQQPIPTQMMQQQQQQQQAPSKPHSLQSPQPQPTPPLQAQTQMQPQQTVVTSSAGSNIALNGPQVMQPSPQPNRTTTPMLAGQTIAIQNQGSQQMVIPSSQPMMMPRMPNQLILNRPLNNPGQLLPGQQQFIQILTPNGPVLLALPPQQSQPLNNSMIDYNNQVQPSHNALNPGQTLRQSCPPNQLGPTTPTSTAFSKQSDKVEGSNSITSTPSNKSSTATKTSASSKSGLDLADILMDCGIIPEDKTAAASSTAGIIKSSQSPSLSSINSPALSQITSPMPSIDSSLPSNTPGQVSTPHFPGQPPMQQQPIRITFGPDGQMVMQPAVYGAIRPMMTGPMCQTQYTNAIAPTGGLMHSNSPMVATYTSSPSGPEKANNTITTPSSSNDGDTKKPTKGKGSGVKRSRSKKSDIDKFPQLKTPKIAQQQQQQQQQQQLQAVTVVPMTVLSGSDVKPSVAQLAGGQPVSLTKIVTPVMQSSASSNNIQTNVPTTHVLSTSTPQSVSTNSARLVHSSSQLDSGSTSGGMGVQHQQSQQQQNQQSSTTVVDNNKTTFTTSGSQIGSSGNVITNLLPRIDKPGTVESNPHISSSLMPTLSISVDTLTQNGLKIGTGHTTAKGNATGLTTLVIHSSQLQQLQLQSAQNQQNLARRKREARAQAIQNQLNSDQNMVLNPDTKKSFESIEDACKKLLRYHVFDTRTVTEDQVRKVDEIFEAAVESLLKRKKSIYDKFRYLILKQSMADVPASEEMMLQQIFVNDEIAHVKKEREAFKVCDDSKEDPMKDDCASEYFAFGNNSPKQNNRDETDSAPQARDVDDWLMSDTWGESRYSSVPDSEAATAIESILNDELN